MAEMLRSRIVDVLAKYDAKLKDAPLDALVAAIERMGRDDCTQPHLGLATTGQLLDELRARFEIHASGGLEYRTIDGEKFSSPHTQ